MDHNRNLDKIGQSFIFVQNEILKEARRGMHVNEQSLRVEWF